MFPLQRAIQKYGMDAFDILTLQECFSQKELDAAEVSWIKERNCLFPAGYNLREGGSGGRLHQSTKDKLSAKAKLRKWDRAVVERRAAAMRGRKQTPEHIEKRMVKLRGRPMSAAARVNHSGWLRGRPLSAEHRRKIGDAQRGRRRPNMRVYRGEENNKAKLDSAQITSIRERYKVGGARQIDLARQYGISQAHISTIIRGECWQHLKSEGST